MAISKDIKEKINILKQKYDSLKKNKESRFDILFVSGIAEKIYKKNARLK